MTLTELTKEVAGRTRGELQVLIHQQRYVILAAPDVFAIVPTQHVCGLRVYEGLGIPQGVFSIMRWSDAEKLLIAEEPTRRTA
jgi:hypothetical protein